MRTAISHLAIACLILFTGAVYACDIAAAEKAVIAAVMDKDAGEKVLVSTAYTSHFTAETNLHDVLLGNALNSSTLDRAPHDSATFTVARTALDSKAITEIEADFTAKKTSACQIGHLPTRKARMSYLSEGEREQLFRHRSGWAKFHAQFGKHAVMYSVSRVAFDKTRTHAVVYVDTGFDWMAGGGEVVILTFAQKRWRIEREIATWTT
jgi:hypothetical protein